MQHASSKINWIEQKVGNGHHLHKMADTMLNLPYLL